MKKKLLLATLLLSTLVGCSTYPTNTSNDKTSSKSDTTSYSLKEDEVDVIILAGQSNMEGNTRWYRNGKQTITDEEKEKYQSGFDGYAQISYKMMGYSSNTNSKKLNLTDVEDPADDIECHWNEVELGQAYDKWCFGPEIGIAEKIAEQEYEKPVYIIKFASGGTNLYSQWRSDEGMEGDRYLNFIPFVKASLRSIVEDEELVPVIKAFCWMQGESDSDPTYKLLYEQRENDLINNFTIEFSDYASPNGIKFIDAGISDGLNEYGSPVWAYNEINTAKINNQKKDPNNRYYIDTIAAGLKTDINCLKGGDIYHYDAESMIKLGHLFGDVLINNNIIG